MTGTKSRWMNWKPGRILGESPDHEPTKPTKPGSVGFVGVTSAQDAKIREAEVGHDLAAMQGAVALLNAAGCRIIRRPDGFSVGVWSDMDGPEPRAAIATVWPGAPVVYLDGTRPLDPRYRVRAADDDRRLVPLSIVRAMEEAEAAMPGSGWQVRDRLLAERGGRRGAWLGPSGWSRSQSRRSLK